MSLRVQLQVQITHPEDLGSMHTIVGQVFLAVLQLGLSEQAAWRPHTPSPGSLLLSWSPKLLSTVCQLAPELHFPPALTAMTVLYEIAI